MESETLKELISLGESEILEFKKSISSLKSIFQTLCAFLNASGGLVLIGVLDNGKIVGQVFNQGVSLKIAAELAKIEPPSYIDILQIQVTPTQSVIALKTKAGEHAPYTYDGRAYQRIADSTSRMPQHMYEQKLVARAQLNHSWETYITSGYTIDDLDTELICASLLDGIRKHRAPASAANDSPQEILQRFQLMNGSKLRNAALLLFSKEHVQFPQLNMKMARFQGKDKLGDFIDNQSISGNLFYLLQEADIFIRRHISISSTYSLNQFQRIDKPALPILAIREALVNAFCHRDYSNHQTEFSLAIFDDRLEIWNSGTLSPQLTIESLSNSHDSILRNPLIANVFYIKDLIEKWGTGTNKIIKLCKNANLPEPEFSERTGGFLVTLYFSAVHDTGTDSDSYAHHLSDRQNEVIALLQARGGLSISELMGMLQNPPSDRMLRKDLAALRGKGLVQNYGSAKNSKWRLKEI